MCYSDFGEVCEWLKQQVSKTCKPQGFEGSNPSLSVFSSKNAFIRCRSLGRIPPRSRACAHSIPPALTPRISAFLFEKIRGPLRLRPFTVYAQSPSPRKKLFFFEKTAGQHFLYFARKIKTASPGCRPFASAKGPEAKSSKYFRNKLFPRASGVLNFYGNMGCDTNCLVSQGFEARNVV